MIMDFEFWNIFRIYSKYIEIMLQHMAKIWIRICIRIGIIERHFSNSTGDFGIVMRDALSTNRALAPIKSSSSQKKVDFVS